MLKLYFYDDEDLNLPYRIDYVNCPLNKSELSAQAPPNSAGIAFEETKSVSEADFIIFPYLLDQVAYSKRFNPMYLYEYLPQLPHFKRWEEKHVFFMELDHDKPFFNKAVFFRTNVNSAFPDVNAVPYPFYVEDYSFNDNYADIKYHTSFVGNVNSHDVRKRIAESLNNSKGLRYYLDTTNFMYYYNDPAAKAERQELYKNSLKNSLTVICPRGYGISTLRFYEAMSAGRLPVVLADGFMPPLSDRINYAEFCLQVPEASANNIAEILSQWISGMNAGEIIEKCKTARKTWEEYLSPKAKYSLIEKALTDILISDYMLRIELSDAHYALFGLKKPN